MDDSPLLHAQSSVLPRKWKYALIGLSVVSTTLLVALVGVTTKLLLSSKVNQLGTLALRTSTQSSN